MSATTTPERAEIESLKQAICKAETAHAATCVQAHYLRAELQASEVALAREHGRVLELTEGLAASQASRKSLLAERTQLLDAKGCLEVEREQLKRERDALSEAAKVAAKELGAERLDVSPALKVSRDLAISESRQLFEALEAIARECLKAKLEPGHPAKALFAEHVLELVPALPRSAATAPF